MNNKRRDPDRPRYIDLDLLRIKPSPFNLLIRRIPENRPINRIHHVERIPIGDFSVIPDFKPVTPNNLSRLGQELDKYEHDPHQYEVNIPPGVQDKLDMERVQHELDNPFQDDGGFSQFGM